MTKPQWKQEKIIDSFGFLLLSILICGSYFAHQELGEFLTSSSLILTVLLWAYSCSKPQNAVEKTTSQEQSEAADASSTSELKQTNDRLQYELAEREHTQKVLQEQAQLLDLAYDTIMTRTLDNTITFWNRGAEEMYGWGQAEVLGQNSHSLLQTQFSQPLSDVESELLQTGRWEGELIHTQRDGTQIVVDSRWVLQRDASGQPHKILEINNNITKRKHTEVALQDQVAILQSFYNSSPLMMGVVALLENDVLHISDNLASAHFFGTLPELMQNRRASQLGALQAHIDQWIAYYRQSQVTGKPVRFEYTHETPTETKWLSATVCLIGQAANAQVRYSYVVEDISDRKQAEAERAKLIAILEATSDIVATASLDQQINYLNSAAKKLFGLAQDVDPAELSIAQAYPPWAYQLVTQEGIPAAIQNGVWIGETAFVRHDGQEVPVSQQIIAHKSVNGQAYLLSTVARDITQQKQIEATLREAERRWRSLLDSVRLMVVGLDLEGNVKYVNAFFLELSGYTDEEVLGKNWFDNFLPKYQQPRVQKYFQKILKSTFRNHYQNPVLTKSGEEKLIAWNNTLLRDANGEIIGTMSIGEDITERQAIERMKDEFISVVSHELRTPLTSIHGALNLLSSGLMDPQSDKGRRVLEIAAESADRLVRLVNDILDLERLESGKISLVKHPCSAADLITQAVDMMQVMANRAGVTLSTTVEPIALDVDPDRIIQVLTNLLSNAIKFSPQGATVWLSVTELPLSSESPLSATVLFTVKDQGRGIPTDKVELIFERFHQVDASDSRKKGGTGLGLGICRSIVQQHGGQIWVESHLGEGSCFYFTLPRAGGQNRG